MTQKFRGDETELKFEAAGAPAFDVCGSALDEYFANAEQAEDFLLMLYDAKRMPFTDRVPRDSFVRFIREALVRFPNAGTFESYLFILRAIFGDQSEVL